jgi:hypothetical protein
MTPDDLVSLTGFATQILVIMGLVGGFIGLRLYFFFRRWSRHRANIKRHKAAGTFAPSGFFEGRQLPLHYDALAGIGSGGEAPVTVGDHILRPAIGVRLFVLGLAAAIVAFLVQPSLAPSGLHQAMRELPVPLLVPQLVLLLGAAWGVVYIFGFEARYNTDMLIVTRLFQRREYRWKHLDWLKDDGGYDLVLTFTPGGKAKVLKHVVGVEAFKAVAEGHAKRNRMRDAGVTRS